MDRLYQHFGVSALEALFNRQGDDTHVLEQLCNELGHRHGRRARRLLARVAKRRAQRGTEARHESPPGLAEAPGPFSLDAQGFEQPPDDLKRPAEPSCMRPPGTRGLPYPWVPQLDQSSVLTLPKGADFVDRFIVALGSLIAEIRNTGAGQRRYELDNGVRVDAPVGDTFYAFPFADEADLFEDAQIKLGISGRWVSGLIVSIASGRLVLALVKDMGPEVKKAVLVIDATALLEALKQKIEQVKSGKLSINRPLTDAVIAQADTPTDPEPMSVIGATERTHPEWLNAAQRRAFERALNAAISYIWGPPGCGKTTTLGEIVRAAFEGGKRVLICSNTNKAVDQVLYRICEALGRDHPAMNMGRVIRLGHIAHDKLKYEYVAYVTVDGIFERRSAVPRARKAEIEEEVARIDARLAEAEQLLRQFEELDHAEQL